MNIDLNIFRSDHFITITKLIIIAYVS